MDTFDSAFLANFGIQLLMRAPLILIWIIGLVLCLVNYSKYPAVAVRCGIACGILLLTTLLGILSSILPIILYRQMPVSQVGYISSGIGFVLTIFSVIGYALLLWAVWTRETNRQ